MAEPQTGTSSSVDPKKKNSPLDEEIGKEFISSWKSLSAAGDDKMDFNFDTVSSGKKKTFNFDKLDMDFNLDGDFEKLTSFKVDLPDLDFSSPSKKTAKPKESSKEESSSGNHRGKRDCFAFSFDFNELDDFNFDSSIIQGGKTSMKNPDSKVAGSDRSEYQSSKVNLACGNDAFDYSHTDKSQAPENATTSVVETTVVGEATGNSSNDNFPSISEKIGDMFVSHCTRDSTEKTVSVSPEEADQQNHFQEKAMPTEPQAQQLTQILSVQSVTGKNSIRDTESFQEKAMPTEPQAQQTTEILPVQSVPKNSSIQDTELDIQVGSLARKLNTESGAEEDVMDRTIPCSSSNHENLQLKNSAQPYNDGSESSGGACKKADSETPIGNMTGTEPMQDDLDFEVTSSADHLPRRPNDKDVQKSASKLLVPLRSEPVVNNVTPTKETESGVVCSKYFKRLKEPKPQLCQPPSTGMEVSSFGCKEMDTLCPANEKRESFNVNDAQTHKKVIGDSKSLSMELAKGEPSSLGSVKNVKNLCNISFEVNTSSSIDKATKSSIQTSENSTAAVSSMGSTWNSKIIPFEGLKAGKKTPDLSSLKITRTTGASKGHSSAVDKLGLSSSRNSGKNVEVQGTTASKVAHPIANAERKTLLMTSLKRKTSEASNQELVALSPRKRLSQSPNEISNLKEPLKSTIEEQGCHQDNQVKSKPKGVLYNHSTSGHEIPQQANIREQDISLAMENDGNVEKAEAYAKELEDICNMLKKKHEEAKEIMVRAIVNNNSLLMLNHPMFNEKISFQSSLLFFILFLWLFF
ncbi:hypothetical protein JCGZ_21532 [Jatropha curcas]|uniref:Uncharacterized protein n=1 Tax=Jatropha curcas TaxID=180498 RepID=A0A067JB78_JATCU|nr:hypothetical protein JCGZ_21532 [Jatropha curcas]